MRRGNHNGYQGPDTGPVTIFTARACAERNIYGLHAKGVGEVQAGGASTARRNMWHSDNI